MNRVVAARKRIAVVSVHSQPIPTPREQTRIYLAIFTDQCPTQRQTTPCAKFTVDAIFFSQTLHAHPRTTTRQNCVILKYDIFQGKRHVPYESYNTKGQEEKPLSRADRTVLDP